MTKSTKLHSLPTLDELVADPCRAKKLSSLEAGQFLAKLAGVQTTLMGRIIAGNGNSSGVHQDDGDTLLTVKEAAEILGCSKDWIYRNAKKLGFAIKLAPRNIKYSNELIQKYIKSCRYKNY